MSALPTLLLKGKLRSPTGDAAEQRRLDEVVPIEYVIGWFRDRLYKAGVENRVLILKSETASGKSTLFPPELYKALVRGQQGGGIICTQPRVITSVENVNEILVHNSKVLKLGENIGWSTKFNKVLTSTSVGLLSATIGTLTQQLRVMDDDDFIKKYRFILIDETHERDLNVDLAIYMLKNLLLRNQHRQDCPFVVLMSATFDPDGFLSYFGVKKATNFIWCVGEAAGFDKMWDWNEGRIVNNYPQAAANIVSKITHEGAGDEVGRGDILVFLPGAAEMKQTMQWMDKVNKQLADEGLPVFSPLQIDGDAVRKQNTDYVLTMYVPVADHEVKIGGKLYKPTRRMILTTNVAETGLTLPGLKYVIDAGFNRETEYNPVYGLRGLITRPAPASRITQRMGRAGRKFRGVFYPLYPEYIYEKLPKLQLPQILSDDISTIAMDIICEQLKAKMRSGVKSPEFDVADIDMVDPPTPDAIHATVEKMYTLGFISHQSLDWNDNPREMATGSPVGGRLGITALGAIMRLFPSTPPEITRMILAGFFWGASIVDLITIGAYLLIDHRSLQTDDAVIKKEFVDWQRVYKAGLPGFLKSMHLLYKVRAMFADEFIDGLILYNAIKYATAKASKQDAMDELIVWCKSCNISVDGCMTFIKTRSELLEQLITSELNVYAFEDRALIGADESTLMDIITRLKYCIYDGYRCNIMRRVGNEYMTQMGLRVAKPTMFRDDEISKADSEKYGFLRKIMPEFIIYSAINLRADPKTTMYEVIADRICVLDGFVSIDDEFTQ